MLKIEETMQQLNCKLKIKIYGNESLATHNSLGIILFNMRKVKNSVFTLFLLLLSEHMTLKALKHDNSVFHRLICGWDMHIGNGVKEYYGTNQYK